MMGVPGGEGNGGGGGGIDGGGGVGRLSGVRRSGLDSQKCCVILGIQPDMGFGRWDRSDIFPTAWMESFQQGRMKVTQRCCRVELVCYLSLGLTS